MSDDRIEKATKRIEAALARIAKVADQAGEHEDDGLAERHEKLKATVEEKIAELDQTIESLEPESPQS